MLQTSESKFQLYCVSRTPLRVRLTMCVMCYAVSSCIAHDTHSQAHCQRCTTQYDMLPQHQINIRKLISECFF